MELDDELAPEDMLLAGRLRDLRRPTPAEARERLMAAVRRTDIAPGRRGPRRWRLVAAPAAALLLLSGVTVGATAASADALPTSPTYSLRSIGERARLGVANIAARERLRAEFARKRLGQVHSPGLSHAAAATLLRDANGYLQDASHDLGELPGNDREKESREITDLQDQQQQESNQLGNNETIRAPAGGDAGPAAHAGSDNGGAGNAGEQRQSQPAKADGTPESGGNESPQAQDGAAGR